MPAIARRPKKIRTCAPEAAVQDAIVDYLRIAGMLVLQTNLSTRKITADKGVPDLIVTSTKWPRGCWLGMEVKAEDGKPTKDQEVLLGLGRIVIVRSIDEAREACKFFTRCLHVWADAYPEVQP